MTPPTMAPASDSGGVASPAAGAWRTGTAGADRFCQTFAVLLWWAGMFMMIIGWSAILVALLFTRFFFWLPLAYAAWYARDLGQQRRGGRRVEWFRRLPIWRHYCRYFPLELVKTAELDPSKSYLFGCHPHGIMCMSFMGHFATEGSGFSDKFPGLVSHLVALDVQADFPVHRELWMALGGIGCSKASLKYVLEQLGPGHAVAISLGGAQEMLEAHAGSSTLFMRKRMGFAKLALETGASLVPVYSFGENDLFAQLPNPPGSRLRRLQEAIMRPDGGFASPVFYGRGLFGFPIGLMPRRVRVHTVVGRPLDVEKVANPTPAQVSALRDAYLAALEALFDEHKVKYGFNPEQKLRFT